MVDAFGASRIQVIPPERGVFPLDHEGACKPAIKEYMSCLKKKSSDHFSCRELSRKYLECRMDKNLMEKENLDDLGLGKLERTYKRVEYDYHRENNGCVGGMEVQGGKFIK